MPQLLALALVGGIAWYGYKAFKHEMARVADDLKEAEDKRSVKNVASLEKGDDGVYRPKKD